MPGTNPPFGGSAPGTVFLARFASLLPALRGALTEQLIGQQLRVLFDHWEEPRLYFWQRGGGRPGEIDFVAQVDARIVPIEVKSGATGSLKSLHRFMRDKGLELAVRCDSNPPSLEEVRVRTTQGDPVRYRLLSIPHYLVWRLPDIVSAVR